jgi:hypothetical protein
MTPFMIDSSFGAFGRVHPVAHGGSEAGAGILFSAIHFPPSCEDRLGEESEDREGEVVEKIAPGQPAGLLNQPVGPF